jgi:DNA-binding Lrp family transcriptional regulator
MTIQPFQLSSLDAAIIRELLINGRKTYTEIAAKTQTTENKIWKRYTTLEKKGIITGATTQINYTHFGYDATATFLISANSQQIQDTLAEIATLKEMQADKQYNSVYNVRAFAALKSLNELDHIKQAIKRKLPITDIRTYLCTDIRNIPENLALTSKTEGYYTNKKQSPPTNQTYNNEIRIDALDTQIMEKLTQDGKATYANIAKQIGTSIDTIMKRIHRLEKTETVKVTAQINPQKIGYKAILEANIAYSTYSKPSGNLADLFAAIPDIVMISKTSGDYDFQIIAMIRDIEQSFAIEDQIAKTCSAAKLAVNTRRIPEKWPTPKQHISTF